MLPIEDQISLLVHLSKADNHVAKAESDMIHHIGKAGGLTSEQVENIIDNPLKLPELRHLPSDERFNYLINTIQLMKIDRKVYQSEIVFCEKVAMRLGFKPAVVAHLSQYIYSDPNTTSDPKLLREIAEQNLL